MNSETRVCQNCKKDFIIEPDDFSFYDKIKVPPPTFCPLCRAERRFVFRNERKLFKVNDAFTNKEIFSLFPKESEGKIVTQEEWHSDSWEGMDYGVDYDFSRLFFTQIFELNKKVPTRNLNCQLMVNSPYCANATGARNSYLCFNTTNSENCMYSNGNNFSKDSIDNSHINYSERCYESFWLENCYQCYFSIMCRESRNLFFCRSCLGCSDCFGCMDLQKVSYCIFNKQYTKEKYFEELRKMNLDTRSGISKAREEARSFWLTKPVKNHQGLKNLDSTGSYITNCKNVNDSFLMVGGENIKYSQYLQIPENKDCYDVTAWGANMELQYETVLCGDSSYNIRFSWNCWPGCKDIEYSIFLVNCSNCFGCVGLKKKEYCIFNKQYTKEEYFLLREKIIKQMNEKPYIDKKGSIYKYGEFFPIELSPFGYNNTFAIEFIDMTAEKAKENGYPWFEVPRGEYKITKKNTELPDSINDVGIEIINEIIECDNCKNAYKILEDEFTFYKKENLPIPTLCYECRHTRRIKDRLKIQLYKRKCMCNGTIDKTGKYLNTVAHVHGDEPCEEDFKTGYSPDQPEIVYCEKCYMKEIY